MANLNNNKKIDLELLAPAGGVEQLYAAINFGANAVYLGLEDFSMRAKASNFTFDELKNAVEFAHSKDVKVHVACNIMFKPENLKKLPGYFEKVQDAGADALIIGDVGALNLAKKYAENVEVHVSTQAAVANIESAKFFYEIGAKRVVLARELTLDEVSEICINKPRGLEVEVFTHGAQCMAESGRCLISSYLCDRSANEGTCTQPCRWGYNVIEEKRENTPFDIEEVEGLTYLFNAQDLCMIEHLQELKDAGVDSLKIEGRNKKSFYVATVVNAYRQVLDGGDLEGAIEELNTISHRPYSTGFYFGTPRQSLDFDGYIQNTLHVADVLDCKKTDADDNKYILLIRCRNKIEENQEYEALIPHSLLKKVHLNNFFLVEDEKFSSVDVANIPKRIYKVESDFEIPGGSFLRKREIRLTSRQ